MRKAHCGVEPPPPSGSPPHQAHPPPSRSPTPSCPPSSPPYSGDFSMLRNAMVSVMLRMIEYFRGILILTTNRVSSFDPAFQTRITAAVKVCAWSNSLPPRPPQLLPLNNVSNSNSLPGTPLPKATAPLLTPGSLTAITSSTSRSMLTGVKRCGVT